MKTSLQENEPGMSKHILYHKQIYATLENQYFTQTNIETDFENKKKKTLNKIRKFY